MLATAGDLGASALDSRAIDAYSEAMRGVVSTFSKIGTMAGSRRPTGDLEGGLKDEGSANGILSRLALGRPR